RPAAPVLEKFYLQGAKLTAVPFDGRQRVVLGRVVNEEHSRGRAHLTRDGGERCNNIFSLVIDGNDDIKLRGGHVYLQPKNSPRRSAQIERLVGRGLKPAPTCIPIRV